VAGFSCLAVAGSDRADGEGASRCFDDVVGDCVKFVDFEDAIDLWEAVFEAAEFAAGGALDGGEGLGVGEVVEVERFAEFAPAAFENELEFVVAEGQLLVVEGVQLIEEVPDRPAEPIEPPDDERVVRADLVEELVEFGAVLKRPRHDVNEHPVAAPAFTPSTCEAASWSLVYTPA
jgi:hypothetical protein